MVTHLAAFIRRLYQEDSAQDLVEYALLTVVVGLAGAVAAPLIGDAIETVYDSWILETNNNWESPNPAGGGS